MFGKKGEVSTFLTVGALIIVGAATLISNVFLTKKQTAKTKAEENCQSLSEKRTGGSPARVKPGTDKKDITGACNLACCQFHGQCPNNQKCEIPNGYCQSGFSCNPATSMKQTCVGNQCVWQPCNGDDCQRNTCTSHEQCIGQNPPPPGGSSRGDRISNGCFSLSADFEVRSEGEKKAFYAWVTFQSQKAGDVKLEYNGIHLAGWSRFNGGTYTYSPQWTQPYTHDHEAGIAALAKGETLPFSYRGMHSGCSPQDITLNCSLAYNNNGSTSVSGAGCSCRNCQIIQTPTPTPRPNTPPRTPTNTQTPTPRTGQPTPTPIPGAANGPCKNPIWEDGGYQGGNCNQGLVCYRENRNQIGICVTPTPTNTLRSTPTPTLKPGQPTNTPTPPTQRPGQPTNTPTPTPTASQKTPAEGEKGGPCLFRPKTEDTPYFYYCYEGLVCSSQDGRGICITPAPTPTPTLKPVDERNTEEIINTKGVIEGKINIVFSKNVHQKIFNSLTSLENFFEITLIKENSGFLGFNKTTFHPQKYSYSNFLVYRFEDLERYYGDKFNAYPNTYSLTIKANYPNGVKESFYEKKPLEFKFGQTLINIEEQNFNLSNKFSEVTLNFTIESRVNRPVILMVDRPFYDSNGSLVENTDIDISHLSSKNFIYFMGIFIGADSSVNYEIVWSCKFPDGNIKQIFSNDPNLKIFLESGKNYERNVTISCDQKTPTETPSPNEGIITIEVPLSNNSKKYVLDPFEKSQFFGEGNSVFDKVSLEKKDCGFFCSSSPNKVEYENEKLRFIFEKIQRGSKKDNQWQPIEYSIILKRRKDLLSYFFNENIAFRENEESITKGTPELNLIEDYLILKFKLVKPSNGNYSPIIINSKPSPYLIIDGEKQIKYGNSINSDYFELIFDEIEEKSVSFNINYACSCYGTDSKKNKSLFIDQDVSQGNYMSQPATISLDCGCNSCQEQQCPSPNTAVNYYFKCPDNNPNCNPQEANLFEDKNCHHPISSDSLISSCSKKTRVVLANVTVNQTEDLDDLKGRSFDIKILKIRNTPTIFGDIEMAKHSYFPYDSDTLFKSGNNSVLLSFPEDLKDWENSINLPLYYAQLCYPKTLFMDKIPLIWKCFNSVPLFYPGNDKQPTLNFKIKIP